RLRRPRPPRPTLFPYTTLFRSQLTKRKLCRCGRRLSWQVSPQAERVGIFAHRDNAKGDVFFNRHAKFRRSIADIVTRNAFSKSRSEEHTSELQSRGHLVCRLLL